MFPSENASSIVCQSLKVDTDFKSDIIEKNFSCEKNLLNCVFKCDKKNLKQLRAAISGTFDDIKLISETIKSMTLLVSFNNWMRIEHTN